MANEIKVTGMVIGGMPVGEYNKRLTLLTRELGKITVFANGAAKSTSPFLGASSNFAFGEFYISKGKNAYNLHAASVKKRFEELYGDLEKACLGSYFLEFADYYAREGMDEEELLKLLYFSLLALINENIPDRLVRRIFELRCMVIEGEYTETPPAPCSKGCAAAWSFTLSEDIGRLYTFKLTDEALSEFENSVELLKRRFVGKRFKALELLEEI